eukprot:TRINITY_DN9339_c0_g1_i2.p1 TRINITY_DN9339_c0_g1~~TRINITY_DN9339_c0_g1_i2.p1  ORF type:complete len:394 (-),score=32.65 TRINITY_DN9339_c0_g1_i2:5-1186(-)
MQPSESPSPGRDLSKGRLKKGFTSPMRGIAHVSSIPTKYETILLRQPANRAFDSSAKRFGFRNPNETQPGPGRYNTLPIEERPSFLEKIHSAKGIVPLAKRFPDSLSFASAHNGPGPGAYNLPSMGKGKASKAPRRRHSIVVSMSRKSTTPEPRRHLSLGPGEYDVLKKVGYIRSENLVSAFFRSGSKRDPYPEVNRSPAPGAYNIDRNVSPPPLFKHNGLSAVFFSKENMRRAPPKEVLLRRYIEDELSDTEKEDDKKNLNTSLNSVRRINKPRSYDQGKTLDESTVNKKDRETESPGPGTYNVNIHLGRIRHMVASSSFISSSKRNPYGLPVESKIAPNTYVSSMTFNPEKPQKKQSFQYPYRRNSVSYTHLRAHETGRNLVCRLLLEKKK